MEKTTCPSCQKEEGILLLWGFPDENSFQRSAKGEVELGGCVPSNLNLNRHCRICGYRWESHQPLQQKTERTGKKEKPAVLVARAKTKRHRKAKSIRNEFNIKKSIMDRHEKPALPPKKSISVLPTLIVFVLALIITFVLAGGVLCGDGWASSAIGRAGACSHHGGVNRFPQKMAFFASVILTIIFHIHRERRINSSWLWATGQSQSFVVYACTLFTRQARIAPLLLDPATKLRWVWDMVAFQANQLAFYLILKKSFPWKAPGFYVYKSMHSYQHPQVVRKKIFSCTTSKKNYAKWIWPAFGQFVSSE